MTRIKTWLIISILIIAFLKKGGPVLRGVKIYPDNTPAWACDHFIMMMGFNAERKEIIYNSFNRRYRIKLSKLLYKKKGYSLILKADFIL